MIWRRVAIVFATLAAVACAAQQPQPQTAEIYADFLIGRIANARDDHAAAADRYFAALGRSPGDEALVQGALMSTLIAGDEARARRAAAMAPRENAPALAHLVRAVDAMRASDWRRASRELEGTEGAAVDEMLARTLLVWVRVGQRQPDDAISQLEPLTNMRPYGGLFAYQQAMALDYSGRSEEALAAYQQAVEGEMFLPPAAERHADALVRAGRPDEARAMIARINETRGNASLAALEGRLGGEAGVLPPLTPSRAAAIGLYGFGAILLQQEHNADGGLIALTLALMLDPQLDAARLMFAEGHARAERYTLARETLGRVDAGSPYAISARILDARLLRESGRPDEALAAAQTAAQVGGPRAERALADMYASLDRYDEAEPIYSALIAADESNWRLYFARGAARDQLGRWPEAEADLQRALALAPDQPDVLNYLGYTWVDRGENLQEGMRMIRRAVELRPDSGAIIDSLGWAHYRMGDYRQALLFLERAVELEPTSATLNDHLGDVYWRLGRRTEARFQWRRALTQEPDDASAIEAKLQHGLPEAPPQ
jgi:tetratricopeptide (TPR) repeat protein